MGVLKEGQKTFYQALPSGKFLVSFPVMLTEKEVYYNDLI